MLSVKSTVDRTNLAIKGRWRNRATTTPLKTFTITKQSAEKYVGPKNGFDPYYTQDVSSLKKKISFFTALVTLHCRRPSYNIHDYIHNLFFICKLKYEMCKFSKLIIIN